MSLNAKLVVVGGDVKTTEIALRLPSTIGRGRGATLVLPHPLVSRQHCELFEANGQLMVRDLGSLNGTFVNNQRITESAVSPGELLTVGTVTFRAVYEVEGGLPETIRETTGAKTVKVTKESTPAASPKPAPPHTDSSDSGPLQFNFDEPLLPGDQQTRLTERSTAQQPTERLKAPAQQAAGKTETAQKPLASKPAPAKPVPAKPSKPAPPEPESSDEDEPASASSDDDLDDFLKSLENK
jgi:pSer/pThr/pTyr-binding forkhead associated (FHA) protein